MYLAIITLPLLGAVATGLLGRKLGVTGAQLITSGSVITTCFLSLVAFYEVGLSNSPVSIKLTKWVDSELLTIDWGFNFDALTVSMLIPVLIVSALVHVYSIGYMSEDPHQQRFFSYLTMFTFFMLILVTGDNYLVMFIGWEGVGISSYLLVSFWFTRVQANKSAISALLFNRVGDMFLTIGLFVVVVTTGNIDYAVIFSIAPALNETIISVIGICFLIGAMAKSAQIGLHVWLPQAMEGGLKKIYYIITLSEKKKIVKRRSISKKEINSEEWPVDLLDAITGDLLGDGHISKGNYIKWPGTNGRLEFTFSVSNLAYLRHLKFNVYSLISTLSEPTAYPNILRYPNKTVTQYWFGTRRLPFITEIHKLWYVNGEKGYIKILPLNISSLLKPIGLAHWIMGDGYYSNKAVFLCTDNFKKEEVEKLQMVLLNNFSLRSTISNIKTGTGSNLKLCWRIRILPSQIERLKKIVSPFFIPEMLYKLGLNKT